MGICQASSGLLHASDPPRRPSETQLAEGAGSPELALHGHNWCQIALLEVGDVAGLDAELAAYERLAEELQRPRYRWYAHARRAMRALLAGDLDAGERLATQALAIGKRWGESDAVNVRWGLMSVVWQERPSPEAAEWGRTMCRTVDAGQGRDSPLALCHHAVSTALAMTEGREEAVRAELDHLRHLGVARVPKSFLWAVSVVNVTPAIARLGHSDEIVSFYNALSPYAGANAQNSGAVTFLGS